MNDPLELPKGALKGTFNSYLVGFLLSIALTLAAYFFSVDRLFAPPVFILVVVGLALAQAAAQLIFFFHLTQETHPRWNLFVFLAMLFILGIIVGGSVWIVFDLDARMMPPMDMMTH